MNDDLTGKVIGAAFRVHNQLGPGFLESVYEKALSIELQKLRLSHERQRKVKVFYEEEVVGDFVCDVFVEQGLLIEIKAVRQLAQIHEVQLVNYLVATKIDIGLLINFGAASVEVKKKYRLGQ